MIPEEIVPNLKYDNNGKNDQESQNFPEKISKNATIDEKIEKLIDNLVAEHNNAKEENNKKLENLPNSEQLKNIDKKAGNLADIRPQKPKADYQKLKRDFPNSFLFEDLDGDSDSEDFNSMINQKLIEK